MNITEFLLARIAEDEAAANAVDLLSSGDSLKDVEHRLMMIEHTGCLPQTWIIGAHA